MEAVIALVLAVLGALGGGLFVLNQQRKQRRKGIKKLAQQNAAREEKAKEAKEAQADKQEADIIEVNAELNERLRKEQTVHAAIEEAKRRNEQLLDDLEEMEADELQETE